MKRKDAIWQHAGRSDAWRYSTRRKVTPEADSHQPAGRRHQEASAAGFDRADHGEFRRAGAASASLSVSSPLASSYCPETTSALPVMSRLRGAVRSCHLPRRGGLDADA